MPLLQIFLAKKCVYVTAISIASISVAVMKQKSGCVHWNYLEELEKMTRITTGFGTLALF